MAAGPVEGMFQNTNKNKSQQRNNGEILNWFTSEDGALYDQGIKDKNKVRNTITIYAHGNVNGVTGSDGTWIDTKELFSLALKNESKLWGKYSDGKIDNITIVLKSCKTDAIIDNYVNFAMKMSSDFKGVTFIAPTENYRAIDMIFFTWEYGVLNDGTWNAYYDGKLIKRWEGN